MSEEFLTKHAAIFDTVRVWDNEGLTMDRYVVCIGEDIWFMSDYPGWPNGVCMYGGKSSDDENFDYLGEKVTLDTLLITVLKQIVFLAKEKEG